MTDELYFQTLASPDGFHDMLDAYTVALDRSMAVEQVLWDWSNLERRAVPSFNWLQDGVIP